jgi:hypothetical protein
MDKTKVVYSWIGPRNPLWNTELPSILSLTSAAFNAQVDSRFFGSDDTWLMMFSHAKDQYEIYPSVSIEPDDDRHFVIPFSLVWRTGFENYFVGRTGLLEYSHIDFKLINLVKNKNGYIFIDYSVEAFIENSQLNALHSYFKHIHQIPLNKIIYLTGAVNAKEIYEEYCKHNNILNEPSERLSIMSYASSEHIFAPNFDGAEPEYNVDTVPEKLFLAWNRRYRQHRLQLATLLEKNNLVDRSYMSFPNCDIERPTTTFSDLISRMNIVTQLAHMGLEQRHVDSFANKLPLVLDGEDNIVQMCSDENNVSRPYYQNSLVSLITETNFYDREVTLTEKSFKPLKEKHPFIIVGVPGCLQGLRDLGYKTFSEFWDESYDTITDPFPRMRKIDEILQHIGSWDSNQILDFKRRVKPIVEHNYQVLKNSSRYDIMTKINNVIRGNNA